MCIRDRYWAEYSTFSISDEVGKYRLTVGGYSGDASDAMVSYASVNGISNGMMFTTPDSDNDYRSSNCAVNLGGCWHRQCSGSLINIDTDGVWVTAVGSTWDVQASRMLVKLK